VTTTVEAPAEARSRLRWWREALYVLAFYGVYSIVRNQFGSAAVSPETAYEHARQVIDVERAMGLYHEETIQEWFLGWRWFIQFWNLFYGTFHFVVTTFCIVWLFRRFPERYVRWRTTLAATTGLALIGFALYPLMPPRLLPDSYGYVDTLREYGGLWSFDDGAMSKVSNQYAAMPSLHFGWSLWCALVLVPTLRSPWLRWLAALYPVATLFSIIVTGNHYWLDAAGGAVVLGAGYLVGRWWSDRQAAPEPRADQKTV
jgi:membrane-associated phospholipid phosphatase